MSGLFGILFFLSLLSIPLGLINPSIFNRLSKNDMTRKKVVTIFGITSFILFLAIGFTVDSETDIQNNPISKNNVARKQENVIIDDIQKDENLKKPIEDSNKDISLPMPDEYVEEIKENIIEEEQKNDLSNQVIYYQVISVVDGDTVKVNINGTTETLRLIGIDTPETVHPTKPVECFGIEASNKAKEILNNKKVSLEADPSQGDRDKYGRLLRYIILEDGTNFNKLMIAEGYAYEYTYSSPYKYQSEFKQAEINARNSKIGLWTDNICIEDNSIQENNNANPPTEQTDGYKWYVSSHYSSKQYYCETDDGWTSLSERYLKEYNSEAELLNDFPNHYLHEPCK